VGVGILRKLLQEAAIRFTALRDPDSAQILEEIAERFGMEKRHSRIRREKWKERRAKVGDGFGLCRVQGCKKEPEWRPVLSFPPLDGGADRIEVETAMLDVCDEHARSLGPEAYTENPDVWGAITKVWTESGMEAPDPEEAQLEYRRIQKEVPA